jgi:hypothetical protein
MGDYMIDFHTLDYSNVAADTLPTEAMQVIASLCGSKVAILLIENLGGRTITIPVRKRTELYDEVAGICGEAHAETIFKTFAGETICIPIRSSVLRYVIRQLRIDSKMIAWLTYTYCVNRSTIYSLCKQATH